MNIRETIKEKAALSIQTWWRHRIFRTIFSVDKSHEFIKGSEDIAQELPDEFHHLWTQDLPSVLTQTQHSTHHIKQIFYTGRLLPKSHTNISGFGQAADKENHDDRIVCTSPQSTTINDEYRFNITFDCAKLINNVNLEKAIYFKVYDWTCTKEVPFDIALTKEIKLVLKQTGSNDYDWVFDVTHISAKKTYRVSLEPTEFIFQGMRGLNQYLTFFVFKILNSLPDVLKANIFTHFRALDQQGKLVEYLQNITKQLIVYSELDFVNPVTLDLDMMINIKYGNTVLLDFAQLKQAVLTDNAAKVAAICSQKSMTLIQSKFFAQGLLAWAETNKANKVKQFVLEHFANTLLIAQHKIPPIPDDLLGIAQVMTELKTEFAKHHTAQNIIDSTPANATEWKNIVAIQTICNQKYIDRLFHGNAALNRMMLLDKDITALLTLNTLRLLFALQVAQPNSPKLQIIRNRETTTITDAIFFALADGAKVMRLMPNNEKVYDEKMYAQQKQNYELHTKMVIEKIYELASFYGINIFDSLFAQISQPFVLQIRFNAIVGEIYKLKTLHDESALINVKGYSIADIKSQCNEGFLTLCHLIGAKYQENKNTIIVEGPNTLDEFVKNIMASQAILLNGDISHLLLDRVHLEAAILAKTDIIIGINKFSFTAILKNILECCDRNPQFTLAYEQFDVRLRLVEKHLQEVNQQAKAGLLQKQNKTPFTWSIMSMDTKLKSIQTVPAPKNLQATASNSLPIFNKNNIFNINPQQNAAAAATAPLQTPSFFTLNKLSIHSQQSPTAPFPSKR